jgi:hypothetical protein
MVPLWPRLRPTQRNIMNVATTNAVPTSSFEDDHHTGMLNRVRWGAIIAGVAAALITQLLLNMLGVGIGAAALDIGRGADNSGTAFSIGAGIWWVLSGIIAAAVGGLTAGRLAGAAHKGTASWHGLVTWCVTTLAVVYLLSSAVGGILGGAFNVLGSVASGAGKAAASTASGVASVTDGDAIGRQAKQLVDPNAAQTVQEDVTSYLKASITGDKAEASAAKARAVDGLARTANVTPAEAQARIDRAEASARQQYQVAKDKATQAADTARSGVATASILGFFALLLGAVASWFAGAAGAGLHERARINLGRVNR